MSTKIATFAAGCVLALASFQVGAQQYTVINLGTLGGFNSGYGMEVAGTGINASGQVTGYSVSSEIDGQLHAFLTTAATNTMTDLGGLAGPSSYSQGFGINASGQVTGNSDSLNENNPQQAFITNPATNAMTDLGSLSCTSTTACQGVSYGRAINDAGQVTGYSSTNYIYEVDEIFLTNSATNAMTDMGPGQGYGINASGQITGWAALPGGVSHAFLTNALTNQITDLGTLGGANSTGFGINASAQVTGEAMLKNGIYHAFLYSTGAMQDLGTLGGLSSQGNSINASGQVTGQSLTSSGASHAFFYYKQRMIDLNSQIGAAAALYTLTAGEGINDSGQIVANGIVNATAEPAVLLLNPLPTNPTVNTETSLSSSATSVIYGESVTLTATVTAARGPVPSGDVIFHSGSITRGTAPLDATGQAMLVLATDALRGGSRSIGATYSSNAVDRRSSSPALDLDVTAAPTTISLVATAQSLPKDSAALTAAVTATVGTAIPSGSVEFKDGNKKLGVAALTGTGQTLAGYVLGPGPHNITAHYLGSPEDLQSQSAVVTVTLP